MLICASFCTYGQQKITAYKVFGGVVYELDDSVTISPRQVSMLVKKNTEAYREFKLARSKNTIAGVLGFTSGVLTAIPLITSVSGGEPEWWYAAAGVGLAALSVPFLWSYRAHANGALEKYNSGRQSDSACVRPAFFFNGTQAGFLIRF